jgi:threonine aldolase
MGNTSVTYRGPNGGKQKLSVKARKQKQITDRKSADNRKEEKATAQAFRRNIKNIDLEGKDVHHRPDKSMVLVNTKTNRGHHIV